MIYVCSHPKCGRTWLRYALAQYCKRLHEIDLPIGFAKLGQIFNDVGHEVREPEYDVFPNIIFSHEGPLPQMLRSPRLMLVRSLLDTIVSYYHHLHYGGHTVGRLVDMAVEAGGRGLVQKWATYYNEWTGPRTGTATWIKYEDLSLMTTWKRILKFMDIEFDERLMRESMEASSFDKMLADEKKHPLTKSTNPNHRRVRKGKIGGWKDEISSSDAQKIINKSYALLTAPALEQLRMLSVFDL